MENVDLASVQPPTPLLAERLRVNVVDADAATGDLAVDVRIGLQRTQKTLPPKYFYDDRGSELFDAICDLPEYYLTRTGQALLESTAEDILATARPLELVELGSGASRKTRVLLDVMARSGADLRYVPMDVSEGMLRQAATALLQDYSRLWIHGVVGDYERHLPHLPDGEQRLVLFLGSTIGNFEVAQATGFLSSVRQQLNPGEHLLLGVDLVKPIEVLESAYNDSAGLTAEFNRNVLHVVNRELNAEFDPHAFEHVAFFNRAESRIEMHLRARRAHTVHIGKLEMQIPFRMGETIHTEISRKFTRAGVQDMLQAAGFNTQRWYAAPNDYFALALGAAV
jgi:L-histidine N-alpha-methyltransferase